MSRRTRYLFIALVAAQVFVFLGLIADREYTLRTGSEVVLKTVPIDPRSLLQGDYVILDYEIAQLPPGIGYPVGQTVFIALEELDGTWEARNYYRQKPSDSDFVYIRGTVDRPDHVDLGIGNYFVPEGSGHLIERSTDVKVVVAVDGRGRAVIKDLLVDGIPFDELRALRAE